MAEAELATIARPYARAAFSKALDQESGLEVWSKVLAVLSATVSEPLVEVALDKPTLTVEDQAEIVFGLMGDELDDLSRNFVSLLAESDRLPLLPSISELFELLKANHDKTMDVELTSAFDISEKQSDDLALALNRKLQRTVRISAKIDQTLIGGVVIRAEDTVIDDSVRGRLEKLSQILN